SDTIDPEALNRVLAENGLPALAALPDEVTAFRCFSWLCDEEGQVLLLGSEGEDTGRRRVRTVDAALAETLVADGTAWLAAQVREDGSIAAGFYPRFDREIETVNLLRHASALWALAEQAQQSGVYLNFPMTIQVTYSYLLNSKGNLRTSLKQLIITAQSFIYP
ncbi:MAG: hypothetical protein IKK15_04275, partial [Akkermansia sp.]|nr:hypothetical protein [Akkermansia sp.]